MRNEKRKIAAGLLLAALALLSLLMVSCEDTDVTAPAGSIITVTASPASVTIDEDNGEVAGQTTIVAQVVDATGQPLDEVPLFFTSTGGLLDSVNNVCQTDLDVPVCSRSEPEVACTVDSDCPLETPDALETDGNGVASDVLTLRLFLDPDNVVVTAKGTNVEGRAEVSKNVNEGPIEPVALIAVTPTNGQRSGFPFALDGSGSTFDPQVTATCFEWRIVGVDGETIIRGPNEQIVSGLIFGVQDDPADEDDLTIELNVSDNPNITCSTNPAIPAEPELFSDLGGDVVSYLIRCDFTPPQVDPIGDEERSINGDGDGNSVSITLTANAFDPQSTDNGPGDPGLTYTWDCDNAAGDVQVGATVSCEYANLGEKSPQVTVRNRCQLSTQRGLTVTITQ
jgi:hypothetical protein